MSQTEQLDMMVETTTADHTPRPTLDRALPGWAVDAIRDGIPRTDGRAVYGKCIAIAMSAHRRGWTQQQWLAEVANVNSRLWAQVMTRRDGRTSSLPVAYKSLRKAWEQAVENNANLGDRTVDDLRADAVELAYMWADRLDDRTDGLSATETAVMAYVVESTTRRQMLRVTCPRRDVAAVAGIGEEAAKGALARLVKRGLLVKLSAGRPGEPGKGRAAIYGLVPVWEEHPIETGSNPMGCSGAGRSSSDEPKRDIEELPEETPTVVEGTPHRETTLTTPHRDTAEETGPAEGSVNGGRPRLRVVRDA